MTASPRDHLVFVDFENVPNIDLALIAVHPVRVTLLIGKNQKRLELALVQQIHQLGDRIQLIEVGASGHNALDLTLAYHLGRAVVHAPAAAFHIVSKDSDFDPLIAHLRTNGVAIGRHSSFDALPFLPAPKKAAPALKVPEDRRSKIIARLTNPGNAHWPSTKRALLAHIKTGLGKTASVGGPENILDELVKDGALTIDPATEKISYTAARRGAEEEKKIPDPSFKIQRTAKNHPRKIGKESRETPGLELLF